MCERLHGNASFGPKVTKEWCNLTCPGASVDFDGVTYIRKSDKKTVKHVKEHQQLQKHVELRQLSMDL